jgi:hypothetical protein
MIGPIKFEIRPKGPPPGPVTIFQNVAGKSPMIAVTNTAKGKNVDIRWQDNGTKSGVIFPKALEPGKTFVFSIDPKWYWILVDVTNPSDSSTVDVSYDG